MSRTITVEGLANARDLGGLERENGSTTPAGVFVRAEMLDRVDESGWRMLRAYGIRSVIDLRRPSERASHVPDGIRHIHIDLDGDERRFWEPIEADGRWGTPLYYLAHLRELPHRLTAVLDAIAAAEDGGILFHCAAGWDRTGLVSAVLLRALDVTEDAATADYTTSFANAEAMAALHGRSFEVEARQRILSRFGHTPESAFRGMYRDLDLAAWLDHAAVADQTRIAIRTWRGSATSSTR